MALGEFPTVPLEDRVYVGVDGAGGFTYVRYSGGVETVVTDEEVETMADQWRFFYSSAALKQVRAMIATTPKETPDDD